MLIVGYTQITRIQADRSIDLRLCWGIDISRLSTLSGLPSRAILRTTFNSRHKFRHAAPYVRETLLDEMERDERVVLLGEDIGLNGGVFRATDGALERFGPKRVFDTPLSESTIVGASVGLSVAGLGYVVFQLITWASLPPGTGMPGMWRMQGLPGYEGATKSS